jgi:ribosomal protein L40E
MAIVSHLLALPLLCLGVLLLTVLILVLVLRRSTHHIQESLGKIDEMEKKVAAAPTDQRQSEMPSDARVEPAEDGETVMICPACGGDNPRGATICQYCGRKF